MAVHMSGTCCIASVVLKVCLCSWFSVVQVNVVQPMTGASSLIAVGESCVLQGAVTHGDGTQSESQLDLQGAASRPELSICNTGGRYDGLIRSFWPPSQWQPMGAVGTTLNVERLISLASPQNQLGKSTLQASQVSQMSF